MLKYGEINIFHNTELESYTNLIWRYLNIETCVHQSSQIIMSFDDDDKLFDINDKIVKRDIEFAFIEPTSFPYVINIRQPRSTILYDEPIIKPDGTRSLNYKSIFAKCSKYLLIGHMASFFNFSYYIFVGSKKKSVFSCIRVKSTSVKPRFLLAYETDYLTESDVIYLVNCIFRNQY